MSNLNVNVGSLEDTPRPVAEYRYGIFIRPPAEIALTALELMRTVQDLFGFHATMAYPPHITLISSFLLDGTDAQLIESIDSALATQHAIPVHGTARTLK
jgi:2'-5' RNA ligase